jgi:hypothetical protein
VLHECALLVLMAACIFLVKWGVSNLLSFRINIYVMRVYVVGADGPVSSCF